MPDFIKAPKYESNIPGTPEYNPDIPDDYTLDSRSNPGNYRIDRINGYYYITYFNRGGDGVYLEQNVAEETVLVLNDARATRAHLEIDPDGTPVLVEVPADLVWMFDPSGLPNGPVNGLGMTFGGAGLTWISSASAAVSGGLLALTNTSAALLDVTTNMATSDGSVLVTFNGAPSTATLVVMGRYISDTNCLYATQTGSTVTLARRVNASSGTSIASYPHVRQPGDVVGIHMNGNQVSVSLNGATVIPPLIASWHMGATRRGVASAGATGDILTVRHIECLNSSVAY